MTSLSTAPTEVIVIDAAVADWKTLTAGLSPDIPVILLPQGGDGVAALALALGAYQNLSAVHLVSHGGTGYLQLGDERLSSATLASHASDLAEVASHLVPGADLLLYGCTVAGGETGSSFVTGLAAALGDVDIAASVDRTGPLSLGGDWDLEFSVGSVETVLPFTVPGMEGIDECLGCSNPAYNTYTNCTSHGGTWSYGGGGGGDTTPPVVSSVSSSTANGTYKVGDVIPITITLSETVNVTGTPKLTLNSGGTANYASGSGTNTLTFNYTVASGNNAADLDYSATNSLSLNSGTIKDVAGNNATLTLPTVGGLSSLGGQKNIVIDGVLPTISSATVPANGTYIAGQNLDFTVKYSEVVTVNTGGGTPKIDLTLDTGGTVAASYVSGSGTDTLTFRYTVSAGNLDSNGVAPASSVTLSGGTIKDAAGNNAAVSGISFASTTSVLVDGVAPSVSSINRVGTALTNASSVDYTVTLSENVSGVDASDFTLTSTGTAAGSVASVSQVSGSTYTVTVNSITGDGTLRLDLKNTGTGISDTAGNAISGGYTAGQTYTFDATAPAVTSVAVPSNATYIAGQNLDFTVNFGEAVTVNTAGGTPRIALTLDTGGTVYASYLSGSGTGALTFRYTVASGNVDTDGVTLDSTISANGGTLRDGAGNNATLTLNSVGSTASVLVDGKTPAVTSVSVPADGTYSAAQNLDFSVTFDEAVVVTGTPYLGVTLDTGGTVQAQYVSGTGTDTLTFRHTVATGNLDSNGIAPAASLTLSGGTIRDSAGNNASLTLTGTPATTAVLVDAVTPTVTSVQVPTNGVYKTGDNLDFTVHLSEAVTATTTGGTPYLNLALNTGGVVHAQYLSGGGTGDLVFRYTVASGNVDTDGITVGALALNGGTIRDSVNNADLTLNSVGSTAGVKVDTIAPVLVTSTFSVAENSANGTVVGTASGSDGTTLTYSLTDDAGGRFAINSSSAQITITNGSLLDYETATSHQVKVKATDAAGNNTETAFTVNLTDVNEAPAITNLGGDAATYVKASTPSIIDQGAAAAITDVDSPVLNGGTLTVSVVAGAQATEDVLGIRDQGVGSAHITVSGSNVSYGGTVVGTFTGGSNGTGLTVTLNANATLAAVQTLVQNITYADSNTTTTTGGGRTVRFVLTDGAGGTSASYDTSVQVQPDIAPVLATNTGAQLETGTSKTITNAMLSVTDADNTTAQLSFTLQSLPAKGTLKLNGTALSNGDTFTQADIDAGKLSFVGASTTGSDNFSFTLSDGAGGSIAQISFNINLSAPEPAGTPTISTTVDGVNVSTQTTSNSDGSVSQTVVIPVVETSRPELVGNNTLADIPLVMTSGVVALAAQVPIGIGLQVSGAAAPKTPASSLADLLREIKAHTTADSADQHQLTSGGSGFLADLPSTAPLLVETIVATYSSTAGTSTDPLVIAGSASSSTSTTTALVIDARGLRSGAEIQLQNVEFAAIIGSVRVTGGAGSQSVWGDSSSQYIVLGADDDVLHGGGGGDTVGSEGGNDRLYGDDGNDTLFGGAGQDLLFGGAGTDVATYALNASQYKIERNGKIVTVRSLIDPTDADTLINVESIKFADTTVSLGTAPTPANATQVIAGLYAAFCGRAPDNEGLQFWMAQVATEQLNLRQVAAIVADIAKFDALYPSTMSTADFVAKIYQDILGIAGDQAGRAYWAGVIDTGLSRTDFVADFVTAALNFNEQNTSVTGRDLTHATVAKNALNNKVAVGLQFAAALGNKSNGAVDSDIYRNAADVLSGVSDNSLTIEDAVTKIDLIGGRTGFGSAVAAHELFA